MFHVEHEMVGGVMRLRDDLIVQALVGMGVAVTVQQLKKARSIVAGDRRQSLGRPSFGDAPMPGWVRWRRHRELESGFSDPLLVSLGPDAPPKPSRASKIDPAPGPLKPPEMTGSGAWAASVSWGCS
jgi:hypothetical protein